MYQPIRNVEDWVRAGRPSLQRESFFAPPQAMVNDVRKRLLHVTLPYVEPYPIGMMRTVMASKLLAPEAWELYAIRVLSDLTWVLDPNVQPEPALDKGGESFGIFFAPEVQAKWSEQKGFDAQTWGALEDSWMNIIPNEVAGVAERALRMWFELNASKAAELTKTQATIAQYKTSAQQIGAPEQKGSQFGQPAHYLTGSPSQQQPFPGQSVHREYVPTPPSQQQLAVPQSSDQRYQQLQQEYQQDPQRYQQLHGIFQMPQFPPSKQL